MLDLEPGQEAELDRLLGERVGAGDHRLAGDDGGAGGEDDEGDEPPGRRHQEEGVRDRRRIGEDEAALAEVVEGEGGEDEAEPGGADRAAAEVAHVGVERLGAGDGEEDRAHHRQRAEAVVVEKADAMRRD